LVYETDCAWFDSKRGDRSLPVLPEPAGVGVRSRFALGSTPSRETENLAPSPNPRRNPSMNTQPRK
jgi:hypothetical protein